MPQLEILASGDSEEKHEPQYVALKLLEPAKTDLRCPSHCALEVLADSTKGKHQKTIRYELSLSFARYLRDGFFLINTKCFDHLHNSRVRIKFTKLLRRVSAILKSHARQRRSISRVFELPGISQECTTYSATHGFALTCSSEYLVWVTIPCEWLNLRYQRWCDYCESNDLPQNLDIDGRTAWGAATRDVHHRITVPAQLPRDSDSEVVARHTAMTERGVLNIAYRRHGRLLHATSNQKKSIRRESLIDGFRTIECDLHAAYTCLLVSQLPATKSKAATIRELQTGRWYEQFEAAFEEHMERLYVCGRASKSSDGKWLILDRKRYLEANIKVEYQRQCLFWADNRAEENPLRRVLRLRHYALYDHITSMRHKLTASAFSKVLMRGEGSLIVDDVICSLSRLGIPVRGNNDGVIVPEHFGPTAHEVMELAAYEHLGFLPSITLK